MVRRLIQSTQAAAGLPHLSVSAIVFNVLHNLEVHTNTSMGW
jgi:hypothetical protein